ncbi:hypothetical protein KUV85_05530 [Nocardioides panacisoli]|uniref:hypothetical protein n=1 Tax=Nocardioides panacisoli TaxID=627624 RepID=UPI001C636C7D|nr:hypothetical protein [Nocardioides panacisoli]QYJ05146.1 hypothetical protein KUV85_05530 [Nocardioides panacisoli]
MTDEAAFATPAATAPPTTGIASLDAVLADVAALADRPVAEHPATFEAAQRELRRPLDDPPAELDQPDSPA